MNILNILNIFQKTKCLFNNLICRTNDLEYIKLHFLILKNYIYTFMYKNYFIISFYIV